MARQQSKQNTRTEKEIEMVKNRKTRKQENRKRGKFNENWKDVKKLNNNGSRNIKVVVVAFTLELVSSA